MPSYSTPGIYGEEAPQLPPSVAPVATSIPAFIGYTEKAVGDQGEDLTKAAVRIASLQDYETQFGGPPVQDLAVNVDKRLTAAGEPLGVTVTWAERPLLPAQFLHYSLQLYFANGGGPCYIYSAGPYGDAAAKDFIDAITALEAVEEPTLLVFPDAVALSDEDYASVVDGALASCRKMGNRFTIADIRDAVAGGTDTNGKVTANFRARLASDTPDVARCGAAYFPYVDTSVPFRTADANVTLASFDMVEVADDGRETVTAVPGAAGRTLGDSALDLGDKDPAVHAAIRTFVGRACVTVPPSGAVAGVYAQVDRARGVWKAPANVSLAMVTGPAITITDDLQDALNVDAAGKSVNAIRAFPGKGTLVWGARTLAGNDNEWRYVNVRRFANFIGESVRKAMEAFVFELNDANTWAKVRAMIENFLMDQWRAGALVGAKPEQAFQAVVGLGKTMSQQDILDGRMIVEVHLAIIRPAEFIVLRFIQKMG